MPLFLEALHTSEPTMDEALLWAIIASPLIGWGLIAAYVRRIPQLAGYVAIAAIGLSCVLSYLVLFNVIDADGGVAIHTHEWFTAGDLVVNLGVRIDGLTAVMLVVVTTVALLVQIYSHGYMAGDPGYGRYFAHMCLFTMSMLGLVLADNLFMMFIFWELVGLCSYLLIGFWFHKPSAAAAAKKAFITTRVGDLGLLAALILIANEAGTFDVAQIQLMALDGSLSDTVITLFALGLFAGAAGKSAQVPLHVWLPDAMEGPTPVSALIHAATMVAAGVYLMARFFPVIEASHVGGSFDASLVIAYVGGVTALLAALIALVQTDLKRVLAYSTISQLGYMMLALGVFGYVAAIFHLFTHAFFKALLFLGSGSVNHSTNTFDMRLMGGLRQSMPITFWTFLIGSLSLAGIFPLAGFWSKDEILLDAWNENTALWAIGASVAFLTAFYMFRAIFLTFFGDYKGGEPVDHHDPDSHFHGDPAHPHESPLVMWAPLAILVVPAVAAGWFAFDHIFADFINGAMTTLPEELQEEVIHAPVFNYGIAISSSIVAVAGIALAAAIYYFGIIPVDTVRRFSAGVRPLLENKLFFDKLYEDLFVKRIFQNGWNRLWELTDMYVFDNIVNLTGRGAFQTGGFARRVQTGQLQSYGAVLAAGAIVIVVVVYAANPL